MNLIRFFKLGFILFITVLVHAQEECPTLVTNALETIDERCTTLARNQACYVNQLVSAEIRANEQELRFEEPGNILNIEDIETLELSPMDLEQDIWGVALLLIQANLPNTVPGQNVPLLVFGDVQLNNEIERLNRLTVTASSRVRVRWAPNSEVNNIIAALEPQQTATAIGRLEDGSWLRVALDENLSTLGWVSSDFVTVDGDVNSLTVMDEETVLSEPMDAFTFSTGIGRSLCTEAPDDGILVQTPEGAVTVTIVANGVRVTLGSTAYLQAEDGEMRVYLIEGRGLVTANEVSQYVPAGTSTAIPLGSDGLASGEPGFPQPYDEALKQSLPSLFLPRPVESAAPLPEGEIETTISSALPMSGEWRVTTTSATNNCGAEQSSGGEGVAMLIVNEDGSSLDYLGITMSRVAEGVYVGGFSGATPGYDNIFSYTVTFTSATELRFEYTLENVPLTGGRPCTRNFRGTGSAF